MQTCFNCAVFDRKIKNCAHTPTSISEWLNDEFKGYEFDINDCVRFEDKNIFNLIK